MGVPLTTTRKLQKIQNTLYVALPFIFVRAHELKKSDVMKWELYPDMLILTPNVRDHNIQPVPDAAPKAKAVAVGVAEKT